MEEFEKMAELEFEEAETGGEGETIAAVDPPADEDLSLEVDYYRDQPAEEPAAFAALPLQEDTGREVIATAAKADIEESPATQSQGPGIAETIVGTAAMLAEPAPAEAAPAAPSPLPEQAETETVPHD
jgi:hypothetical protein